MTALEAATWISALLLAFARLGRSALPVLRLSNHPVALVVIALLPLAPHIAESFTGVATGLDLADAVVMSISSVGVALRGKAAPLGALLFVGVFTPLTACTSQDAATRVRDASNAHRAACGTYLALRPTFGPPITDAERDARGAADLLCSLTCEPGGAGGEPSE